MTQPSYLRCLTLFSLAFFLIAALRGENHDPYGGTKTLKTEPTGYFRLDEFSGRPLLVTPEGHGFIALGINHISSLERQIEGGIWLRNDDEWDSYWQNTLQPQYEAWHCNTMGYGGPTQLRDRLPWFGTIGLALIEKHRSDPKVGSRNHFYFPDVFDPKWAQEVSTRIEEAASPHRGDPFLVGWFWTDTPTWDLHKTRALRRTDWVSELRRRPPDSPGRKAYAKFLLDRYNGDTLGLEELNEFYGLALNHIEEVRTADLTQIAIGRHRVQEDDYAFLALIAQRFYDVVGLAQRQASPNHLIFGDRYLAGDAPTEVLEAARPWIDAVAVQPGDRYSPLYPASTHYPEEDIEHLHRVTGKPVFICDHAISFPTEGQPRTIFEQMPSEEGAAQATRNFLAEAFSKPYQLGYLRCQYVDRPAGSGRGLRQGLIFPDGTPREELVKAYRESFGAAIETILGQIDSQEP
ncbi:MAG: hypothetical protein AAGA96_03865 [Verrucomicrobiota bacterium]